MTSNEIVSSITTKRLKYNWLTDRYYIQMSKNPEMRLKIVVSLAFDCC